MTIQHKLLPDSQLHEPKGVNVAANKTAYIAQGSGTGTWRRIKPSDIDNSVKADNTNGWNDVSDGLYTVGSPLSVTAGVRTLLTNNGLAAQSDSTRLGNLWNAGSNQFTINDLNAVYNISISCKVKASAAASAPYVVTFEIESSTGPTVISGGTQTIKGGSVINSINQFTGFYVGSSINNLPLKVYITPDTNITVYDIGFFIQRTYKEL